MPEYSKEELWELYEQIPKDLQKATFSEEVGRDIRNTCKNHDITDEDLVLNIIKKVGYVFLGLLSPNEFSDTLKTEIGIAKIESDKITADITRLVFAPVKKSLEALYQIKISVPKKSVPKRKVKDRYREKVE